MLKKILALASISLSLSANAAITYQFDFTNLSGVTGGTGADFSISLTYSDYVTTTGMTALPDASLSTTLGYSVAYAGSNDLGWWGFDNDTNSTLSDGGFIHGGDSFVFVPSTFHDGFFVAPGTFGGRVGGNAPYSFSGNAQLTITETNEVPIPSALLLFGSGLLGLVGIAKPKKA